MGPERVTGCRDWLLVQQAVDSLVPDVRCMPACAWTYHLADDLGDPQLGYRQQDHLTLTLPLLPVHQPRQAVNLAAKLLI